MEYNNVLLALLLTIFAGLSTGIGSAIGLFFKKTNYNALSLAMGFSAGVMIYISFVELFQIAKDHLTETMGTKQGNWILILSFFSGIAIITIIDKLIPHKENPHEFNQTDDLKKSTEYIHELKKKNLYRTGKFTALAIAIHNFPEGIATFLSSIENISLGIPIAIAIAIHNIPEGIAVSVPIYYSTENKKKAFWYSFLSGLAEPVGAIIGYFLFIQFIPNYTLGIAFAAIAGIMVFISLDQLLPAAEKYGAHHFSIYGILIGMVTMAISINLFL